MSGDRRSFWSSVPGLITGLAGLLTGVVGGITLLVQQGVIGSNTTGAPATTAPATTATTTLAVPVGTFTVTPNALNIGPTDDRTKTVTVRNTSATASISVQPPVVTGADRALFPAAYDTCTSAPLKPNLSCTLKVTFTPAGALRSYKATLQVEATGAVRGEEVAVTATTLL